MLVRLPSLKSKSVLLHDRICYLRTIIGIVSTLVATTRIKLAKEERQGGQEDDSYDDAHADSSFRPR